MRRSVNEQGRFQQLLEMYEADASLSKFDGSHSREGSSCRKEGTLKMQDRKMQDWKMTDLKMV